MPIKLFCFIDNKNDFCFIEAENPKKAVVLYSRYIGEYADVLDKVLDTLTFQEILFIFNKFNHQGTCVVCVLEVEKTLFGEVKAVKESDFK